MKNYFPKTPFRAGLPALKGAGSVDFPVLLRGTLKHFLKNAVKKGTVFITDIIHNLHNRDGTILQEVGRVSEPTQTKQLLKSISGLLL